MFHRQDLKEVAVLTNATMQVKKKRLDTKGGTFISMVLSISESLSLEPGPASPPTFSASETWTDSSCTYYRIPMLETSKVCFHYLKPKKICLQPNPVRVLSLVLLGHHSHHPRVKFRGSHSEFFSHDNLEGMLALSNNKLIKQKLASCNPDSTRVLNLSLFGLHCRHLGVKFQSIISNPLHMKTYSPTYKMH